MNYKIPKIKTRIPGKNPKNLEFPNIKNPPTPKNLATSRCEAKKVAPRKCGCETKIGILVLGILEFLGNFAQEFYIEFKIPESRIPRIKL